MLPYSDPDIVVQITSKTESHNLTAGTNLSLMCNSDGTTHLRPELSFAWMHFNGTDTKRAGGNSSRLNFPSLKLSEAGEYMCQVNIRSHLLNSDLTIMSMFSYPVRVIGKLLGMVQVSIDNYFLLILPNQHSTLPSHDCHSTVSSYLCWVIS